MARPLTERFADWCTGLSLSVVPEDTIVAARRAVFDTIGAIAAGAAHPAIVALTRAFAGNDGPCSVVGRKPGVTPVAAALINGAAAHAWDFDDTSYTGIMHGSAIILPAALAVAEDLGADEQALLSAFIAGSEIAYVLADVTTHAHFFNGWWSTATIGLVGATAAVARLHDLDASRTAHAISIAAASASGVRCLYGTDAKPILAGETAKRAIEFVQIAKIGLTGPIGVFEDSNGFFAVLNNGVADLAQADTLGKRWRLVNPGLLFKTSPVCSAAHAAIDLLARLLRDADANAEDIAAITVEIPDLVRISLVHDGPKTPQQAQFSLPYALACAALHGRVRLEDLTREEVASAPKQTLMAMVTASEADDLSTDEMRARYPESARIVVVLKDGRELSGFCGEAYGMPNRPLTDADMIRKFADCLAFGGAIWTETTPADSELLTLANEVFRSGGGPSM